jgi:hypothetical protein
MIEEDDGIIESIVYFVKMMPKRMCVAVLVKTPAPGRYTVTTISAAHNSCPICSSERSRVVKGRLF